MRSRLLAAIAASGLALASTLVEARGPGGGQPSMGSGFGHAPARSQSGNMSQMRTQDQERNKSQAQDQSKLQDQQRTRTQDQERIRER